MNAAPGMHELPRSQRKTPPPQPPAAAAVAISAWNALPAATRHAAVRYAAVRYATLLDEPHPDPEVAAVATQTASQWVQRNVSRYTVDLSRIDGPAEDLIAAITTHADVPLEHRLLPAPTMRQ
jgi:hypothetical protein